MLKRIRKKIYRALPHNKQRTCLRYYKYFTEGWFIKNPTASLLMLFLNRNPAFFEQKYYSQNGEDGIIKAIFSKIKTTNKHCVEIGIHEYEGNTIHLKKKGWKCLWMDSSGGKSIKKETITAENINRLLKKYRVPKEFDLLSIDIDFNDYWVWKAIKNFSPRVVVIEYNAAIPPTESKVVKYDPKAEWDGTDHFGASLLALVKLGRSKGYTLVECDKKGVNAFFVRDDLVKGFRKRSVKKIYRPYAKTPHPVSKKVMIKV